MTHSNYPTERGSNRNDGGSHSILIHSRLILHSQPQCVHISTTITTARAHTSI